jgi:hypothetical protein
LDWADADFFQHNVAKLLFLCKRTPFFANFLCTRVKAPDSDDYKKLTRVVRSIRATRLLPLTLATHSATAICWWVDASFVVHDDMRSHTGGAMTLGKGVVYGTSTGQKFNTRSSTEGELVGVHDVMPQILGTHKDTLSSKMRFMKISRVPFYSSATAARLAVSILGILTSAIFSLRIGSMQHRFLWNTVLLATWLPIFY